MLGEIPRSVLEIGYGTGTFIEAARITGAADCAGFDIAKFPLPEGVRFVEWPDALESSWDVVAMFDVLEHIPDLSFLARLRTRYLAVAVPYCRWRELGPAGGRLVQLMADCVFPMSICTTSTARHWMRCWPTTASSA